MARKTPRKVARKVARKVPRRTAQSSLRAARGSEAQLKGPRKRVAADKKAAAGAMPQWTPAEIAEAFRRFQAAMPEPKGELKHVNPFTLLVAVVLSAQATDAGVNKATPALFAAADTPQKMAALGEERVRELVKTIGLFRTKAKNVVALSKKLVEEHAGEVPRTREALEALPGVGRKTANVVLNIAFGEPTIAVDTHIFRVGNRTGMATGKTPFEVEMKLNEVVPPKYRLHAHHWLILHGRYVCVARRPLCERCVIADLCKWPGKTVVVGHQPSEAVPWRRPAVPARRLAATTIDAQLKFLCDSQGMIAMHRSWGKIVIGGLIAIVVLGGAVWASSWLWSTPKESAAGPGRGAAARAGCPQLGHRHAGDDRALRHPRRDGDGGAAQSRRQA